MTGERAGATLFDLSLPHPAMSGDPPAARELRQGMTVRIVQGDQDPHSTDTEPVVGEVTTVLGEDPEGPEVELKSGVVGHVRSVVTGE